MSMLSKEAIEQKKYFPFNLIVNVFDGGFFGLALGFASFSTVIPLFVSTLTDSAILIGLIPAIHVVGWQLPQLFTAQRVAQQKRYKPMVMFFTIHERWPFLGLAFVSWFVPQIGPEIALGLTFFFLICQGLGGGLTATAWQSMIGKIIPAERWGFFFGVQSGAANLLAFVSAILAGILLVNNVPTIGFTLCFIFACIAFAISYLAISFTREESAAPKTSPVERKVFWKDIRAIFFRDKNFRWFIVVRILAQLGTVGFVFYSVYVVRVYGVDEAIAGILTGVMMATQTIFNLIMGWMGDRWSHRGVMALGMIAAAVSAGIAIWAPSVGWFYLVYALAGIANVAVWTIALAMTLEFGQEHEKPSYIGMANTLIAPTAFFIPLFAGWLADNAGYQAAFLATAIGAIATMLVLGFIMQDHPRSTSVTG
jgi:MFS family permease